MNPLRLARSDHTHRRRRARDRSCDDRPIATGAAGRVAAAVRNRRNNGLLGSARRPRPAKRMRLAILPPAKRKYRMQRPPEAFARLSQFDLVQIVPIPAGRGRYVIAPV